ncbi:MAG TPA: RNA polymerase sigma factor [Gemmatimonadales bacterium]|nr:RNA polymerase sigma factor [Gemmatimonadales bacterium]
MTGYTMGRQPEEVSRAASPEDHRLLDRLRSGDEAAFTTLVERYGPAMLRFARLYVADAAIAEDAVQDTWMGVLRGLDRFEARASLRTWIFHILLNRLKTRLKREGRFVPFSRLFDPATATPEPAVEPERFLDGDHPRWPYHWKTPPESWGESPEERVLSQETRACIERAVAALPPAQREVITLRDIEGWRAEEVCNLLGITESNQRVLLHRARSKVRRALEDYFAHG